MQCLRYLCLVISSFKKQRRKSPRGNPFLQAQILTHYIYQTMSTWGQYEKSIAALIHHIRTKMTQTPGQHPLLIWHHPPNLEDFIRLTKNSCSSKNCTQFDSLPSDLLHNIDMWNLGLVHRNKLKSVLDQITQQNFIIFASTSY